MVAPFLLLDIIIVALTVVATRADPTDPTVYKERRARCKEETFNSEEYEYHCNICEVHVFEGTKHCGRC